jgi:YHS domain-containing protein
MPLLQRLVNCEQSRNENNFRGEMDMRRVIGFSLLVCGLAVWGAGCAQPSATPPASKAEGEKTAGSNLPVEAGKVAAGGMQEEEHEHKPGAHGGIIVSLGRDRYHVEAIVTDKGELRLYMLGSDETRVHYTDEQELTAYVRPAGDGGDSISITVKSQPQPGDSSGKTSLFVGALPESLVGKPVNVTIPNIAIGGERFRLGFTTLQESHGEMPEKVADQAEQELYLTAAGKYTEADIEANGRQTASQKFAGFKAAHDLNPQAGDKVCPITLTKANPKCSWVINGQTYEFCCPPCVDEFVKLAKTAPEQLKAPGEYVK